MFGDRSLCDLWTVYELHDTKWYTYVRSQSDSTLVHDTEPKTKKCSKNKNKNQLAQKKQYGW